MIKNAFFTPQKVFSFSKYLNFYNKILVTQKNGLIRKVKLISKLVTSQHRKQIIVIHVLPNVLRSKGNQTMTFGQLKECNMRNIFLKKIIIQNMVEKLFPDPFLNQN